MLTKQQTSSPTVLTVKYRGTAICGGWQRRHQNKQNFMADMASTAGRAWALSLLIAMQESRFNKNTHLLATTCPQYCWHHEVYVLLVPLNDWRCLQYCCFWWVGNRGDWHGKQHVSIIYGMAWIRKRQLTYWTRKWWHVSGHAGRVDIASCSPSSTNHQRW